MQACTYKKSIDQKPHTISLTLCEVENSDECRIMDFRCLIGNGSVNETDSTDRFTRSTEPKKQARIE